MSLFVLLITPSTSKRSFSAAAQTALNTNPALACFHLTSHPHANAALALASRFWRAVGVGWWAVAPL
jgi:hypothetical protein